MKKFLNHPQFFWLILAIPSIPMMIGISQGTDPGRLHTLFYILDVKLLQDMISELWALGIWTGWLAFVIFIPLAMTSNQASIVNCSSLLGME
jgi:hypothetical protein